MSIKKLLTYTSRGILALLTAVLLGPVPVQAAGSASFSASPSSGSYQSGAAIAVTISENSGSEPVNVVEFILNYDASKLRFDSVTSGGSAFDAVIDNSGGGGSVHVTRYRSGGGSLTGGQVVARINFTALVGSGSTSLRFGSGSHIVHATSQQDIWNGSTSAASFSFTTPTTSSSTGSSGSSSSSGGASSSSRASGTQSTAQAATPGAPTPTNPEQANPETQTGDTLASQTSPHEHGKLVAIKVVTRKGVPLQGYIVAVGGKTVTTDSYGIASFVGVSSGEHQVTVRSAKSTMNTQITVRDDMDDNQVQEFEVRFTPNKKLWLMAIPVAVLLFGGLGFVLWRKWRKHRR